MTYTHKKLSERSQELLESSSIYVENKVSDLMADRGLKQSELAVLTGLRQATLHDIIYDKRKVINMDHLKVLMLALNVTDINELYEVKFKDEAEYMQIKKNKDYCELNGVLPQQEEILSSHRKKGQ